MDHGWARRSVLAALLLSLAAQVEAQCPDGSPPPCPRPTRDPGLLAIRPFTFRGPAADAWLGAGVTDIIRAALDGAAGWRLATPRSAARAGTLVDGTVFVFGRDVRVRARLLDGAGRTLRTVERRGSAAAPAAVIDSVAADLTREGMVRRGNVPTDRAVEFASASNRALRAFSAAETAARAGRWQEASDSLQQALGEDSTFGLAYYRLYIAATAGADVGTRFRNAPAIAWSALRVENRLTTRQRDVFQALGAAIAGDRRAALARAEALEQRWPDDPDARYTSGEVYFHLAPSPAWRTRSLGQFDTALRQDSSLVEAYSHVVSLRASLGDTAGAWSALRAGRVRAPTWAQLERIEIAMRVGLRVEPAPHLADSLFRSHPDRAATSLLYRAADEEIMRLFDDVPARAAAAAEQLYAVLAAPDRSVTARTITAAERSILAAAQGRHRQAWEQLDLMQSLAPGELEVQVFSVMLAARTGTALDRGRRSLDALRGLNLDTLGFGRALEGWFAWAAGDTATLRSAAEALRLRPDAESRSLADGCDGWLALLRGDSSRALLLLRAVPEVQVYGYNARSPERAMVLTLARLELAAGDPVAAERALDLIYLGRDGLFYRAEADEIRAASAQVRGDRETARRALQSMLSLWAGADAELQPRVASARAELARLGN